MVLHMSQMVQTSERRSPMGTVETLVHLHSLEKLTLSLFLSTNGTSYVSNGSNFWKKISDGNG